MHEGTQSLRLLWRSTETSLVSSHWGSKYRDDVRGVARSLEFDASFRNVANPSREIGPIAYFYHAIPSTDLILAQNTSRQKSRRTLVEHSFCSCYSMRLSQPAIVISSLAATCEAFRFTVWLGDKCTISGTGTKPSDQELLVIPQTVDSKGCMVRATSKHPINHVHELTKPALFQKYELMEYGYDQSLLIRPEADDGPNQCMLASLSAPQVFKCPC